MRALLGCRWHLDEVFVKINGERHYLWRAVDQEGEVLEAFVSKKRGRPGRLEIPQETDEALPQTRCDHHGSAEVLPRGIA